jgi:hypothetical protein
MRPPPRSALPLPRYVVRRWSRRNSAWVYLWNLPGWAIAADCPVANERLGTDYGEAVKRAETVLLPAFDAWRGGEPVAEQDAARGAGRSTGYSVNTGPVASTHGCRCAQSATGKAIFASSAATS